jgi:hypothetical protein
MNSQAVRVKLYGFKDRELQALRLLLGNESAVAQLIISEQDADIAIVDLDGADHALVWKKLKETFSGPVITLSFRERKYATPASYIPKPYHSDRLIEVIKTLSAWLKPDDDLTEAVSTNRLIDKNEHSCSHIEAIIETDRASLPASEYADVTELDISQAAEIVMQEETGTGSESTRLKKEQRIATQVSLANSVVTPGVQQENKKVSDLGLVEYAYMRGDDDYRSEDLGNRLYYQPADMLQGVVADVLSTARQTGRPVFIEGLGAPLFMSPLRSFVLTEISSHRLAALCRISISMEQLKISLLDEEQAEKLTTGAKGKKEPIATFLWKLAILCARGRVPVGAALDEPVRLTFSPELTLPPIPGGDAISLLWRTKSVTLRETPERLRIPYRDVFNFYSAAKVVGLIESECHLNSKKGLFGRLVKKLRPAHAK